MKKYTSVTVQVPATSANLGPGFDSLGIAVTLYNQVTVTRSEKTSGYSFSEEASKLFFKKAKAKPFSFTVKITGDVPMSRGLGSSVTVRLGFLIGLNLLAGSPLLSEEVLGLVIELEGHPDNAVPAFYGGFACASKQGWHHQPIKSSLQFVTYIPDMELETKKARGVLPKNVSLGNAITNLQNTALITAAFCSENYALLKNGFEDTLHQPFRSKLLPPLFPIIQAAQKAGALGGFLSGAGSTIMAMTLQNPQKIAKAMANAARKNRCAGKVLVLSADNKGYKVLKKS